MTTGKRKPTKAIVGAIGATLTAATSMWTAITVMVGDDAVTFEEYGSVVSLVLTFGATVYGIWKVENKPVSRSSS